jgi:hypothetical protein
MLKKIFYIILFIVLSNNIYSQIWKRNAYEFYYGIGAVNFNGDVAAPNPAFVSPVTSAVWVNFWNTIGFISNTGLRYQYSDRQYLRGNIFIGQLRAKDPQGDEKYWDRNIRFNSVFLEIDAKYEFMIWKESRKFHSARRKSFSKMLKDFNLPTYLFIGIGGMINVGNFKYPIQNNTTYDKKAYVNVAPIIPIGIGFKYRLNRHTYVNLEAEWHFSMSDGIDGVKGTPENRYGEWFDQYQTITVNLIHKLNKTRSGLPNFKRMRFK